MLCKWHHQVVGGSRDGVINRKLLVWFPGLAKDDGKEHCKQRHILIIGLVCLPVLCLNKILNPQLGWYTRFALTSSNFCICVYFLKDTGLCLCFQWPKCIVLYEKTVHFQLQNIGALYDFLAWNAISWLTVCTELPHLLKFNTALNVGTCPFI